MSAHTWVALVIVLIIVYAVLKAKYLDPPAEMMQEGKVKQARKVAIALLTFVAVFTGVYAVAITAGK